MEYENLTPEQRERAKSCSTPEEFLELSHEIGYELSDEELEAINGGLDMWGCTEYCPGYSVGPCASGSVRSSEAGSAVGLV